MGSERILIQDDLNPVYEDNFMGCLVGLAVGEALGSPLRFKSRREIAAQYGQVRDYLGEPRTGENTRLALQLAEHIVATGGKVEKFFQESLPQESASSGVAGRISPLGLLFSYGRFDRERFLLNCEIVSGSAEENSDSTQGGIAVAVAVRALNRAELLPEDLMSAALDYLPFGLLDDNPLRDRLLAAQDFLEERQTLVDNMLAGNLLDVDLFRVDLNNMERCGVSSAAAQTVAAAFYAFTVRKSSFEEALLLALNAGGDTTTITAVTGALAGAYHGLEAIPLSWRKALPDYPQIIETARRLHKTARGHELTDYVDTGI